MKLALLATALVLSAAAFAADAGAQTPTAPAIAAERGYGIFCSDADFQGTCRTFGPGEYRRLPRGLDNRISSGRRISENYPYQGRPNWERR